MKPISSLFLGLMLLTGPLLAQQPDKHALVAEGVDFIHQARFDEALEVFERVIQQDPASPVGYFHRASVHFWLYILEWERGNHGDLFKDQSKEVIRIANARLRANRRDPEARLYKGRGHGNLGRYYAMTDRYFKAYWNSKKGKNVLKSLLEDRPSCVDAQFELGLYHYYAALAPKILRAFSFLLGLESNREQGLAELTLASEQGDLTQSDALFFLQDLYVKYEEDFDKATQINEILVGRYPSNPVHLTQLAECYRYKDERLRQLIDRERGD